MKTNCLLFARKFHSTTPLLRSERSARTGRPLGGRAVIGEREVGCAAESVRTHIVRAQNLGY